jgi:glutamine cyclotransferase
MKIKIILLLVSVTSFVYSCKNKNLEASLLLSPEAGTNYKQGQEVIVKLSYPADLKPDSIVYLLDSARIASKKDSSAISLKTDTMPLGPRGVTAKFYHDGKVLDASTNIVLLAPKAPEELTYKVEKVYPHDTSSYTEGFEYHDGYLYESTGNNGHSALKKVNLETGKAVQEVKMDKRYFGEGLTMIGDKIIQLTYKEKTGFVYDKNTFKTLKTFPYNVGLEGWGLCNDGNKLYTDDSTNRIWFLDKNDYHGIGFIDVYDDKEAMQEVNELEYIDGKLYSNVYTQDTILVINPKTGAVMQRVDMKNLWPMKDRPANFDNTQNVLNGIAWDEKGKRLFVTGKKWPHVYQVKFVKK